MSCGLRDVIEMEALGKPSVLVGTHVFVDAAEKQARLLGAPDARRVFVPHPIQDRTDDEVRDLARAVAPELIGALERHAG